MKRRALLCSTAGVVSLAGCQFNSSDVVLDSLDVLNIHTEPHEVHVTVIEEGRVVLLDSFAIPAASRENGTLHGESMTVDLPKSDISDFALHARLETSEAIHQLVPDDFTSSHEIAAELQIDRSGQLVILFSTNSRSTN